MSDRLDITDLVTALLHAIDQRDWSRVRSCFGDTVAVDYTSLFGGEPETLTADALIARWRALLPGFDSTQHISGPVLVSDRDSDTADARTAIRGYHYAAEAPGGPLWMVAGHYQIRLCKTAGIWAIDALTLETAYQEGNSSLPAFASERAAHLARPS